MNAGKIEQSRAPVRWWYRAAAAAFPSVNQSITNCLCTRPTSSAKAAATAGKPSPDSRFPGRRGRAAHSPGLRKPCGEEAPGPHQAPPPLPGWAVYKALSTPPFLKLKAFGDQFEGVCLLKKKKNQIASWRLTSERVRPSEALPTRSIPDDLH